MKSPNHLYCCLGRGKELKTLQILPQYTNTKSVEVYLKTRCSITSGVEGELFWVIRDKRELIHLAKSLIDSPKAAGSE
jgi:hypothetical protein